MAAESRKTIRAKGMRSNARRATARKSRSPFSRIWRYRLCAWTHQPLEARRQTRRAYSRSPAAGACPERCLASGAENDRPDQPRDDQGERRNACPARRHPRVPLGAEPCPRSGDPCGRCNRPHHELHAHGGSVTPRRERRQLAGLASVYARRGDSPAASKASHASASSRRKADAPVIPRPGRPHSSLSKLRGTCRT
jgi:hypothetical protein